MKRLNITALLLIILTLLLASISSILSNAIILSPSLKDASLPLLGLFLIFTILITFMQQMQNQKSIPESLSFEKLQQAHPYTREKMLRKVESNWNEYRQLKIFTTRILPIKFSYQPVAIDSSSAGRTFSTFARFSLSLPYLNLIAHDGLLILGSSGAGKTTALLELTRTFLIHAKKDEHQPIPVVLSLSSWNTKQPPLHEWLAQELQRQYSVSQERAQFWIQTDQLLPLLDDFDMVADIYRTACIQAINVYQSQHGLIPLVVCSRSEEYLAQPARLRFQQAVMLQPLSQALVETFIAQERQKLQPLRTILKRYPQIQTYVRHPLLLDLLARAIEEHASSTQEFRSLLQGENFHLIEQMLLNQYVQKQLEKIALSSLMTSLQTCQTLHWLALNMKNHHQTTFTLEELQPDWLPDGQSRKKAQQYVLMWMQIIYITVGELNGFLVSQTGKFPFMTISFFLGQIACHRFFQSIKNRKKLQKPDMDVPCVELLSWAWKNERPLLIHSIIRVARTCFLFVGGCIILFGLPVNLLKGWTFGLLSSLLIGIFAVICLFAGGIVGALRVGLVRHQHHQSKRGIGQTAWTGILYGLILGGGIGSIAFLIIHSLQFGLNSSPWFAIALGISSGINIWVFCSLMNGGYTFLQYYVIHSLLKKTEIIPGKLPTLLHIAVQCRLLCLINGSFRFPNRWLLDYFATHFDSEENTTGH